MQCAQIPAPWIDRAHPDKLLSPQEWLLRLGVWSGAPAVATAPIAHDIPHLICQEPLYKALAERFRRRLSPAAPAPTGATS